jgi:cytochrome b subunit of formate dehydrogenase
MTPIAPLPRLNRQASVLGYRFEADWLLLIPGNFRPSQECPETSGRPNVLAGLRMRRWIFLVLGVLLAIVGVLWIGQGLKLLGQSGGMNGQHIWALIGLICAVAGLAFITAGVRAGRAARLPRAR